MLFTRPESIGTLRLVHDGGLAGLAFKKCTKEKNCTTSTNGSQHAIFSTWLCREVATEPVMHGM